MQFPTILSWCWCFFFHLDRGNQYGGSSPTRYPHNNNNNTNSNGAPGATVIDVAKFEGKDRAIDMLINVPSVPSLHMAIARGDDSTAERLIDNRVNVNEQTSYGATPLFIAGRNVLI